jgi:multidrug efflux pump subunit AcrA (membrane-fusion protein)
LWTDEVQAVYASLPEATRNLPWTIATLGEMAAAGIVDAALVESLKNSESLRARFVDAAGLLLQGQTVARLNWLSTRGALDSEFDLRAPGAGPEDWDVLEVLVRPGQTVAAGQTVAVLHDSRSMWLRVEPVGDEVMLVMDALRNKTALRASPLLAGVGPELSDLSIFRLAARGPGEAKGGDVAFIRCANQRLDGPDSNSRSWQLRAGMRYVVQIPGIAIEKVFVFPKSGVGKEGVDRVVYKQDGDSFRSKVVRVLFEDDHHVVVKNDGALFPGNVVAMKGAFVLGIAMQTNTGSGGAHAGHSH